jgi:hypothetical protein
MDNISCIVIHKISNDADMLNNVYLQIYATGTAALFVRKLLKFMPHYKVYLVPMVAEAMPAGEYLVIIKLKYYKYVASLFVSVED